MLLVLPSCWWMFSGDIPSNILQWLKQNGCPGLFTDFFIDILVAICMDLPCHVVWALSNSPSVHPTGKETSRIVYVIPGPILGSDVVLHYKWANKKTKQLFEKSPGWCGAKTAIKESRRRFFLVNFLRCPKARPMDVHGIFIFMVSADYI